jgi:hypothetical protein
LVSVGAVGSLFGRLTVRFGMKNTTVIEEGRMSTRFIQVVILHLCFIWSSVCFAQEGANPFSDIAVADSWFLVLAKSDWVYTWLPALTAFVACFGGIAFQHVQIKQALKNWPAVPISRWTPPVFWFSACFISLLAFYAYLFLYEARFDSSIIEEFNRHETELRNWFGLSFLLSLISLFAPMWGAKASQDVSSYE